MDVKQSELISPFGPKILVSKCPQEIVDSLNDYTEKVCENKNLKDKYSSFGSGNVPDLLERNLETIFIGNNFSKNFELNNYLEKIGNLYLQEINFDSEFKAKINKVSYGQRETYNCWINRYFNADFTPLHIHAAQLSGIIFLKIPKFLLGSNLRKNPINSQGTVSFIYGIEKPFCHDIWSPDQKVGTVLVFPSWLRHIAYPTCSDEERRTFSFNLNLEPVENNKVAYS